MIVQSFTRRSGLAPSIEISIPMKKFLIILAALFSPLAAFAQSTTITLPPDFNSSIMSQAQSLLASNSIGGFAELVIGVILAAVVLEIIIGAIRK